MTLAISGQLLWIVLGVGFNLVSYVRMQSGRPGLMPTPPLAGIKVLIAFIPLVLLGILDWLVPYVVLSTLIALFIAYVGVYAHARAAFNPKRLARYQSPTALWTGAAINAFGLASCCFGIAKAVGIVFA